MDSNPQHSDIIFYNTPICDIKIEVIFNDETFWLTQKRMAELFGVESNTITYQLKEIYKTGELEETATARKIRVVQKEGKRDVSRNFILKRSNITDPRAIRDKNPKLII